MVDGATKEATEEAPITQDPEAITREVMEATKVHGRGAHPTTKVGITRATRVDGDLNLAITAVLPTTGVKEAPATSATTMVRATVAVQ